MLESTVKHLKNSALSTSTKRLDPSLVVPQAVSLLLTYPRGGATEAYISLFVYQSECVCCRHSASLIPTLQVEIDILLRTELMDFSFVNEL